MEDYYVHPCHCTEISYDEYRRVAGMKPRDDRMEKFLLEKEQLKALSDDRIKKWPNTLKNLRENRVKARKARTEKEEIKLSKASLKLSEIQQEQRRKQDVLDATFRAQKRREQLEKSNLMLLRPHIKELQFKAMMREILHEREEQVKCKNKIDGAWKNKDKWWHEMLMQGYRRGVVEDEQELQRRRDVAIAIQKMQSEQLEERHQRFLTKVDEKKKEGERLKKLAAENDAAAEERDRQKHLHQLESNKEFAKLNIELQERRDAEKEKLKLLDLKIVEYVSIKEKRDAANKAEKDKIQNEKNAHRDYLIDKQAKQLIAARAEVEQRLGSEAQEERIAQDMREVLAVERRQHEWEICDRSRKQQIHLKKTQQEMDHQDKIDTSHQIWQRVLEVQKEDEEEFRKTLEKNKIIAQHCKEQASNKKNAHKKEQELEITEAQTNWKKMEEDDDYIRSIDIFNQ